METIKKYSVAAITIACLAIGYVWPGSKVDLIGLVATWLGIIMAVLMFLITAALRVGLKREGEDGEKAESALRDMHKSLLNHRKPEWLCWFLRITIASLLAVNGFVVAAVIYLLSCMLSIMSRAVVTETMKELDAPDETDQAAA